MKEIVLSTSYKKGKFLNSHSFKFQHLDKMILSWIDLGKSKSLNIGDCRTITEG